VNTLDLASGTLLIWRLDMKRHAGTWDSGEGAFQKGGRWNPRGLPVVYCSQDPATAILEVAAHKGFDALDTARHVMTCARITDTRRIHVVKSEQIANRHWLIPGSPSRGQQNFGRGLLQQHSFVAVPSTVSRHSWNVMFCPHFALGMYALDWQEDFALDPRLNPPDS
jgi:RES domain-containing protein